MMLFPVTASDGGDSSLQNSAELIKNSHSSISSEICNKTQIMLHGNLENILPDCKVVDQTDNPLSQIATNTVEDVSNSISGSAFIVRDDVLLFDPATDLVLADKTSCSDKCADSKTSLSDATKRWDELIKECEHVLHLCENGGQSTSMQDLLQMNTVLTDMIYKIEANQSVFNCSSLSHNNGNEEIDERTIAELGTHIPEGTAYLKQCIRSKCEKPHICSLPVELLHKLFSYFTIKELCTTITPVCKLWSDLASDPIHWKKLDLSLLGIPSVQEFCKLINRCQCLIHFSIGNHRSLSSFEIIYLVKHCHLLKSLDLGCALNVDIHVLEEIVKNCPELEFLNVEGIVFSDFEAVANLLCKLRKLKTLNVSNCNLLDNSIILLSKKLSHLIDIDIGEQPQITDVAVKELVRAYHGQLESLILDGEELTDESVEALSQCPRLRRLHILFCEQLTDRTLMFVKKMSSLIDLKLRKAYMFSAVMLKEIFDSSTLGHLQELTLSECSRLEDEGVIMLAKCCGQNLTRLDLSWCWDITDEGIKAIIKGCRKLIKLELIGLDKITGCDLPEIPLNMPNLLFLDLTQCHCVDDHLAVQVAQAMPQLTVLNYYGNNILHFWE